MEVKAASPAVASTGSRTMADMVVLAARKHGGAPALRHKVGDRWADVSFRELGETVREIALGLVDVGIEPGDRVAIISQTRPEWTYACFGVMTAGATAVSIYPTNSPEECHYVLDHSGARAVFVEDSEQLEKLRRVEHRLPQLERVIAMDSGGGDGTAGAREAIALDHLRERGRARDDAEFEERVGAIAPEDACLYIYTSGTTGPPKGCILTHGNYRAVCTMAESRDVLLPGGLLYLFLPLAHAFAVLARFLAVDLGGTIAYWERDPQRILPNLAEVRPTDLPSVPRIFEKGHTAAASRMAEAGGLRARLFWWAVGVGRHAFRLESRGERPGTALRARHALADRLVLSKVRERFGGNLRQAITGAAPIATDVLEFFWACGIPVLEGYGMTETSTVAALNTRLEYRLGSVGRPLPGVDVRIAEDGEVLVRGDNVFAGYHQDDEATAEALVDGWLRTGDLGYLDEAGYLYITGRKKDILITAGGKNVTPANLENALTQNRWISQAVVLGDRRPYLVALITLDPDEAPAFARQHGLRVEDVPTSEQMRAEVQRAVDAVNARVGRVEQIKRFRILPRDLSLDAGEITPTLKVKRGVVAERYAHEVDELYAT